ncbi:MAG: hypothetical protein NTX36_15545 [Proteobacteria bacterium]|nr:hypothetical protein [Pseudomonadota bacterium]
MVNREIWHKKYHFGDEKTPDDTALRVAKHVANGGENFDGCVL